jgi:hypothetical protein
MACELGVQHGLHERAEAQHVVGRDEVDGRPHHGRPHDAALEEEIGERLRPESVESRPEREVRVARDLRLQTDEVLDGVERGSRIAMEEQLALERRTPESPRAEDVDRHSSAAAQRGRDRATGGAA